MIHDENTNNKLLVLFVLDKLEMPINEELLLEMCSIANVWIPYIYCKQVINDLLRSGFITRVNTTKDSTLVSLTTDGRTCLAHFYTDIAFSVREEVTEYIRSNRITYRKRQEFKADYYRNSDGSFTVQLSVLEVSQPLLDMKLVVPNRPAAMNIQHTWSQKAPEIYKLIYENLIES